jgi:Domain of unknown function (DUF222)/HNH endonuclease
MALIHELLAELARSSAAIHACLATEDAVFTQVADDELLELVREVETTGRVIDSVRTKSAAEVARRSKFELGYSGLAVRLGHRTPDNLLANITGITKAEAAKRLRVGAAIEGDSTSVSADGSAGEPPTPFIAVGVALQNGDLGLDQADAIVRTLLNSVPTAEPADLAKAIDHLVASAGSTAADALALEAQDARAELTRPNPVDREAALRAERYLRVGREIDGLRRIYGQLDPESAGIVVAAFDAVTNPRRGGPRFVDEESKAHAKKLQDDERTDDQLRLDAFVEFVRLASSIGHKPTLGAARPALRVVITSHDLRLNELDSKDGTAHIDGIHEPISAATARRLACDAGFLPVTLGTDGEILDVGVENRLFTPPQRTGLAVRDGGCRWTDCELPPAWCEAHHMEEWSNGGKTDINNGILLCRHHHLLLHNNGWKITRERGGLAVIPPPDVDPLRRPRPLPPKSRAAAAALRYAHEAMAERHRETA